MTAGPSGIRWACHWPLRPARHHRYPASPELALFSIKPRLGDVDKVGCTASMNRYRWNHLGKSARDCLESLEIGLNLMSNGTLVNPPSAKTLFNHPSLASVTANCRAACDRL